MRRDRLLIGGDVWRIRQVSARFGLSMPFVIEVEVTRDGDENRPADLVGRPFELELEDERGAVLPVRGLVVQVRRRLEPSGLTVASMQLGPELHRLALGRDHRVFQDMSSRDIATDVLERAGVPGDGIRWSVAEPPPPRIHTVQHGESDLAFLHRILGEDGIFYWFELGDGATTVVFEDDSTNCLDVAGEVQIPFRHGGVAASDDAILEVSVTVRRATTGVRLRDHAPDKPSLALDALAGEETYTLYDFPGRFDDPDRGKTLAGRWLESLRAGTRVLSAWTNTLRVRAGNVFELVGHPTPGVDGRWFVTEVTLEHGEGQGERRLALRAIPVDVPFRPARAGSAARVLDGPETGVVVGAAGEEIHPDDRGRVRVQLPWDREGARDDKASTWMRVGQFATGGSMILPRIGWDVLVDHEHGDVDVPLVVGHLYDGEHPTPYALPDNKTRSSWQTATSPGDGSTSEVRFEDAAGSEEIFINAAKDMNVVVDDASSETIGVDLAETIGSNRSLTVTGNLKQGVTSNQSMTIGGSETLTVSGGRVVSVGGDETISIGASRSATITGGETLEAKAGRTLTVGGSMISAAGMGVNRSVLGSLSATVGGAWIQAAGLGVTNATGGAVAETVGGAKIQAGASGVKTGVKGAAAETVGGAYVITAGGNAGESATGALRITVGGAFVGNAPSIEIEAESEIAIQCGGSSLKVKSSKVEVKAPLIAAPAAVVKKKAGSIEHN